MILCVFPGVGKTHVYEKMNPNGLILDSDSSTFPKDGFPQNYIDHIKAHMDTHTMLVSTHQTVRDALVANGLSFSIVCPAMECKEEYKQRYLNRQGFNGGEKFAQLIDTNWDAWVGSCLDRTNGANTIYEMGPNAYLSHAWEDIMERENHPFIVSVPGQANMYRFDYQSA